MTGAAHVAFGVACALAVRDPRVAVAAAVLSHPVLDLAGRYHPKDVFVHPDTWQKRLLVASNAAVAVAFAAALLTHRITWQHVAVGAGAWLWADVWWLIRAVAPRFDRWNPHRLWWIRGEEHQEHLPALWWELAVMLAGCIAVVM